MIRLTHMLFTITLLSLLTLVSDAEASLLTASQLLSSYNLITRGSATTTADIEGSVVVGGKM